MSPLELANLFSGEDFRWQIRFERGEMSAFFGPRPGSEEILAERRHWLRETPEKYAVLLPEGASLLDETIELARSHSALSEATAAELARLGDPMTRLKTLGGAWEADFCLMGRNPHEQLLLQAGVVCFPSHWSLPDKIGKPMHAIHGPVPLLNEAIGRQIDAFLQKLKPGTVWLRANWGISRTAELNQHPDRKLLRLASPVRLDEAFLRIERQALLALPESNGVLFGIRIEQTSLADMKRDRNITEKLIHGLRTMDPKIAEYKGFAAVRNEIVEQLSSK